MRKWFVGVLVAALMCGGVAYAADVAAPTLADVYKLLTEIKSDVAALKGGSSNTNQAGNLASAASTDGKVTITITSLMAGPDATVVGFSIKNETASPVKMGTFTTALTAGGAKLELSPYSGLLEDILPGTTAKGLLLASPVAASATELTFRTEIYDSKSYKDVMETSLVLKLK